MTDAQALPPWPSRPALFLDLDGTLLEIVDHPRLAAASARLTALLPALPLATGGAVALVSGRAIEDIDRILAPHSFVAAGVHGLQRRDAAGRLSAAAGTIPPAAQERVRAFAARHGLLLEDKGVSLALHYRNRAELEADVHRFVESLQALLPPEVEVLLGHKVVEIKPNVANKGDAIRAFMEEAPFNGRTPVFAGDDVTDELGFAAVNALGGVSVKVGEGDTAAGWRLRDVSAVLGWLEAAVARPARA